MSKKPGLLDLGVFNKNTLIEEYGQILDKCVLVLNKNNYLNRLISEAKARECYIDCSGNILRFSIDNRVNIEYWASKDMIRVYGFKLYVWDGKKIVDMMLFIIEGLGESYVSGICNGIHVEYYIDENNIVLVLLGYSEKLSWECIS